MTKLNHPFVIKMEYAFVTKNYLAFVLEYCSGGELFYHLRKVKLYLYLFNYSNRLKE